MTSFTRRAAISLATLIVSIAVLGKAAPTDSLLKGQGTNGDCTSDAPGVRHLITQSDLPQPYATPAGGSGPKIVQRPEGVMPKAPDGFKVEEYASGLNNPRNICAAPNGDLFVMLSGPGELHVLRDADGDGRAEVNSTFAKGLNQPFGIAFYPPGPSPSYVYVCNTLTVVRYPYKNGDLEASGPAETIVDVLPSGTRLRGGGHWTRTIVFSRDGKKMYISVGSVTNNHEDPSKPFENRAAIHEYNPDGSGFRLYAEGIRNAVGLAFHPQSNDLWASVQEKDGLGDDLVCDYITRIKEGGFYGWPWYYTGPNEDPLHKGKHPELKSKVIAPDVLTQSHSANMCLAFYTGQKFPREYRNQAFVAMHGSSNRSRYSGYKIVMAPSRNGIPTSEYIDFVTGFNNGNGEAWGRPVGVATGKDGALYFSEDGNGRIYRVSYVGK